MFWHCNEVLESLDISEKKVLILEITQSNNFSYSCRVTQKYSNEYDSNKDNDSFINLDKL